MLQSKRTTPLLAVLGAVALMTVSAPAFAQNSTDTSTAAASASNTTEGAAPAADSSGDVSNGGAGGCADLDQGRGRQRPGRHVPGRDARG